jgi:hypothetical protein
MRQKWSLLALTAILTLGMVDAAAASSIVFTKGGNVWRSSLDGRHQTRLTRDGGYSSPSQDDRGGVYAIQRGRFVCLTPRGRRIGAPFNAAVGRSGNVTAYGPWEAQVSPDGSRIAYRRGIQRVDAPVGGYTPYDLEDQVVVSRSDRFTPDSTFGYQRDYRDPSWGEWFSDHDAAQIGDGELSRDASTLVVLAGGGLDLNNIALYRRGANSPPEAPERVCTYHSADGSTVYADPTFSPRGNAIAFAQDASGKRADGVYVWSFGNCSGTAKLIARGAVDPDLGPR